MYSYHQVKVKMKKIFIKIYMQNVCHKSDYLQYTFFLVLSSEVKLAKKNKQQLNKF